MQSIRYSYSGKGPSADLLQTWEPAAARALLATMLRIRRVEEAIASRYALDEMKTPIHLSIGQEAISAGLCAALAAADGLFCSYRSHGHYLAKGGDLGAMLAELHGRTTGCAGGRGGSMHLLDLAAGLLGSSAIVGGVLPLATGYALAELMRGSGRVIAVAVGDAAMEEGVVWESLNFAALRRLPLLVICENNFYSVCSPLHARQPQNTSLAVKAAAFGLKAGIADGTDVLQTYAACAQALAWIQAGEGPVLFEARAYRWLGHHGGTDDSASGYRSPDEVAHWRHFCPIETYADLLTREGLLTDAQRQEMEARIQTEIEAGFAFALSSPAPGPEQLLDHVYAEAAHALD